MVLSGYKLEPLVLVQLSERYEVSLARSPEVRLSAWAVSHRGPAEEWWLSVTTHSILQQMEYLGRHIAQKLNINYFDCLALSYRHVVRHWPVMAYPDKDEHKNHDLGSSVSELDL